MKRNTLIGSLLIFALLLAACEDPFESRTKWTAQREGKTVYARNNTGEQITFELAEELTGMYRVLDIKETSPEEADAYGAVAELWVVSLLDIPDERPFRPGDIRKSNRFLLFPSTPQVRKMLRKKIAEKKEGNPQIELYGELMHARASEDVYSRPIPELFYVIDFNTTW
jgi:hypothetical protein